MLTRDVLIRFNADERSLDDLQMVVAQAEVVVAHLEKACPDWLAEITQELAEIYHARMKAEWRRELRKLELQEESMLSDTEKRAKLAEKKAELQKKLS